PRTVAATLRVRDKNASMKIRFRFIQKTPAATVHWPHSVQIPEHRPARQRHLSNGKESRYEQGALICDSYFRTVNRGACDADRELLVHGNAACRCGDSFPSQVIGDALPYCGHRGGWIHRTDLIQGKG